MAYTFNETNFKDHLRRNSTGSWFSINDDNVRYQYDGESTVRNCAIDNYPRYTVKVNGVLRVSELGSTGEKVGSVAGMVAGTTGIGLSFALAPFTFGGSLLGLGVSSAGILGSGAAYDHATRPGKVYFTLSADDSEWVADMSCYPVGVGDVANNICWWSKEIYEDKFEAQICQIQLSK